MYVSIHYTPPSVRTVTVSQAGNQCWEGSGQAGLDYSHADFSLAVITLTRTYL